MEGEEEEKGGERRRDKPKGFISKCNLMFIQSVDNNPVTQSIIKETLPFH